MNPNKLWTEQEIMFLKENHPVMTIASMATHIGRTREAVQQRCLSLGLRKGNRIQRRKGSCRKAPGEVSWNKLFYQYQRDAADRNRAFLISKAQFIQITSMNCHYCGAVPRRFNAYCKPDGQTKPKHTNMDSDWINQQWVFSNGIDRTNNDIGYEAPNCVPCCKACNYYKRASTYSDFMKWIEKLASFRNP